MRVSLVKEPTWTCCGSPAPLEGTSQAKEEGKKVREENKMRGRVETAARSTCQKTLETELCRQMLRRLALRRLAKRTELTNHFSLSHCEQRTRAHREIKTLHNASTQQIENQGGRESVSATATSTDLGRGRKRRHLVADSSVRSHQDSHCGAVRFPVQHMVSPATARDGMEGSTCQPREV